MSPLVPRIRLILILLFVFLVITVIASVSIGAVQIPLHQIWSIAGYKMGLVERLNWSAGNENIVWLIRFPRVLLALVVGAGLAVVGVTLQALVRNPLADSYILGISSGASVGAVLAIGLGAFAFAGPISIQFGGFLGALVAFILVFVLSNINRNITPWRLILAGIGVGYFFSGVTSFITLTSKNRDLAGQILSWTLGSLARATWFDLGVPSLILVIAIAILLMYARNLNALVMGDETATTLGINVIKFRRLLFILVSLVTGVMVAVSGSIGFIGLMVPHIVRLMVGPDHRYVLPISAMVGSIFLIWVDVIARSAFAPAELPVGIITFLLGGPFFLMVLWRSRQRKKEAEI